MKKVLAVLLLTAFSCCAACSCSAKDNPAPTTAAETATTTETTIAETTAPKIKPDTYQIQSICNLATLKCYFHNTAKGVKEAGTGVSHWGEKDTPFWFEYTAQATLGIDGNQVNMVINDNDITVYMPHAKILGNITVDPDSTSNPIYRPNAWYRNDVEITAADVTKSMSKANDEIRAQISSDKTLLNSAEKRAKDLIENYIGQIMELSGVNYRIHWETVEDKPTSSETSASEAKK